MEEIIKSLQEKYIEDVKLKYPIHRVFCVYMLLIAFYFFQKCNSNNLFESLRTIKITFLITWEDGIFSSANVYQLMVAIFAVALISGINNYIRSSLFDLLVRDNRLDEYIESAKKTVEKERENFDASIMEEIRNKIDDRRGALKAMQAKSEIMITCIVCLLINMKSFDLIEAIVCILLAWAVLDQQRNCFGFYLSKFIPYYVSHEIALGKVSKEAQISKDTFE